jgi:UDP-N-acetylglucosamine 2-epimerase (non-hydrolysing)
MAVGGARPNFMKLAPLWYEAQRLGGEVAFTLVHTGQHTDELMSSSFLRDLGLPTPRAALGLTSTSPAAQIGEMISKLAVVVQDDRPDVMVVVGDVNSTAAAAIAGNKSGIRVAHVEAGLRSFDRSMPEEINRLIVDQIADVLLASEPEAIENLRREGIATDRCHLVGNLMIDCLCSQWNQIESVSIDDLLDRRSLDCTSMHGADFGVMTLHRPSNVDSQEGLLEVLQICRQLADRIPMFWPVHPRTMRRLEEFRLLDSFQSIERLWMTTPLTYHRFIKLLNHSTLVLTDSGGIQEETTYLGVPCITMRENTERPLTITAGTNRLCQRSAEAVNDAATWAFAFDRQTYSPPTLWDGMAAHRTLQVLLAQ